MRDSLHQHEIAAFLRCAKKYEYSVVRNWEPLAHSDIIQVGSAFHAFVATIAGKAPDDTTDYPEEAGRLALDMATRYHEQVWLHESPFMSILHVEEPLTWAILTDLVIRPDLVYEREGVIYVRDYKTMGRLPDNEMRTEDDLDFQANLYCLIVSKRYPGKQVVFEYEFIRAAAPRDPEITKEGKISKARAITTRERYVAALERNGQGADTSYATVVAALPTEREFFGRVRILRSESELQCFRIELEKTLLTIASAEVHDRFPRSVIKTGGEKCGGCYFFPVCKRELYGDRLDATTVRLMGYKQREEGSEVVNESQDQFG